jgi:ubiquinone/menaquinone biosynthesis C-methylase UbiE
MHAIPLNFILYFANLFRMKFYDKYILPKLTHLVCSQNDITRVREKLVPLAKGRILEVGIGSGLNLPFYDPTKVDRVWGLDPSSQLKKIAKKKAARMPFDVDFIGLSGEDIPLEKNSVDTVLVTYTLCSIPDVRKALNEMNRVLRPGGELIFYEHGRSPDKNIRKWQDKINPIWTKISGGCNLNRPISNLIKESGFKIINLDAKYNSPLKVIGFNYRGIAVPA